MSVPPPQASNADETGTLPGNPEIDAAATSPLTPATANTPPPIATATAPTTTTKHQVSFTMSRSEFLADLYDFMARRGQPISKLPFLGYQELDLYRLYKSVIERGGMDSVTRQQEWKTVYQALDIPTMSTSASYNTRTNYKKYLYLYELEHCDFATSGTDIADKDIPPPKFLAGQYVKIESSTYVGAVFYAQVVKHRYDPGTASNQYYVHYNGWNNSHDEWMPESVLDSLSSEESRAPWKLTNPSPTRSSKSNYIIYDPMTADKHPHGGELSFDERDASPLAKKTKSRGRKRKSRIEADEASYEALGGRNIQSRRIRIHLKEPMDEHSQWSSPIIGDSSWDFIKRELRRLEEVPSLTHRPKPRIRRHNLHVSDLGTRRFLTEEILDKLEKQPRPTVYSTPTKLLRTETPPRKSQRGLSPQRSPRRRRADSTSSNDSSAVMGSYSNAAQLVDPDWRDSRSVEEIQLSLEETEKRMGKIKKRYQLVRRMLDHARRSQTA